MIIDEAIKVIETDIEVNVYKKGSRLEKALRLGIEALTEVARARRLGPPVKNWRLPGETEK